MTKTLKELNVLYVDDDLNACESLNHILNYYFQKVFIANNGKEALNIYNNEKCHLLIVDYDMPIMDGYEFLSQIRRTDDETPAFMISSYDDKIKLKNAIKLNLLEYLVKPYELQELKDVLKSFTQSIEKKGILKYQITKDCIYNKAKKIILCQEKEHKLTAFEIKILEFLLKNRKKVVSYSQFSSILDSTSQKSLISIMHKLKRKLPKDIIENIKGIGYKLN